MDVPAASSMGHLGDRGNSGNDPESTQLAPTTRCVSKRQKEGHSCHPLPELTTCRLRGHVGLCYVSLSSASCQHPKLLPRGAESGCRGIEHPGKVGGPICGPRTASVRVARPLRVKPSERSGTHNSLFFHWLF